jgi:hypothetical protein
MVYNRGLKMMVVPSGNYSLKRINARGIKKVKCSDCKNLYYMGDCSIRHNTPNLQAYRICSKYSSR